MKKKINPLFVKAGMLGMSVLSFLAVVDVMLGSVIYINQPETPSELLE